VNYVNQKFMTIFMAYFKRPHTSGIGRRYKCNDITVSNVTHKNKLV